MPLHILSLETSSAWCGVTLMRVQDTGPASFFSREHQGVQEHSARLLPMIDQVLAEASLAGGDIDTVAFGQGPGGFTGLRVACGVAQGLGFALGLPVLPVVSHAAVAVQVPFIPGRVVVVAMDARMQEVYVAAYRQLPDEALEVLMPPQLMALPGLDAWLLEQMRGWSSDGNACLCGDAMAAYPDSFAALSAFGDEQAVRPTAPAVARLAHRAWLRGEAIAPELAMPLYVRDKVAFTTNERASGSGGNPRVNTMGLAKT
jgi:tRNA threonylcarbamoyladenosine biosynthesis protein TsaB